MLKKRNINFFLRYYKEKPKKNVNKARLGYWLFVGLVCASLFAVFGYVTVQNAKVSAELVHIERYLLDEDTVQKAAQADSYITQLDIVKTDVLALTQALAEQKAAPVMNDDFYQTLYGAVSNQYSIEKIEFNGDEKKVSVTVRAARVEDMPQIATSIENTGLFGQISYGGYERQYDEFVCVINGFFA